MQGHPYHLVESSPWPVLLSVSLLSFALATVLAFHGLAGPWALPAALASVALVMGGWFKDVNGEGAYLGAHTTQVQVGLTVGFLLFVLTEVMFFISVFWAFLHVSLAPAVELGTEWPPKGVEAVSPWNLPLLNTVLLLSSGAFLTMAHHYVVAREGASEGAREGGAVEEGRSIALTGFALTVGLSLVFTLCQLVEFAGAPFTVADSAYATAFYFGTTFHGIHVVVGTVILSAAGWRLYSYLFTSQHCAGMEGAIVYWHMVDVVWLLLFVIVYWLFY